eukprot:m.460336 g.460336  ORF g.460336 m.460336 type:complete len:88 (-) comp21591_c1_seq2:1541-1804(-)
MISIFATTARCVHSSAWALPASPSTLAIAITVIARAFLRAILGIVQELVQTEHILRRLLLKLNGSIATLPNAIGTLETLVWAMESIL